MFVTLWRISGLLFASGGLLSAGGAALFASREYEFGSWLTIVGVVFEGVALILLGVGFRGSRLPSWAVWILVAAGALLILVAVFVVAGTEARLAKILIGAVILLLIAVAAVAITATRAARRSLYSTLGVLALFQLINALSGAPATLALVGIIYVVLGILLLRGSRPLLRN